MTDGVDDVVLIGADAARVGDLLREAGVTDVVTAGYVESAVFDEATHTWVVHTDAVEPTRTRILIAAQAEHSDPDTQPYLGVAAYGSPNRFVVHGRDAVAEQQVRYIARCLEIMRRDGETRIEVRNSTQRSFNRRNKGAVPAWPGNSASDWQRMRRRVSSAFDLTSLDDRDGNVYDGPATLTVGDDTWPVRARLAGHLDPIDGKYHWRGTASGSLPDTLLQHRSRTSLTIGERTADARITERTTMGNYSVSGVGPPPFVLDDVKLVG
jgi:hypothetical protein